LREGIIRSLANFSASSSFDVTHIHGPGSSAISQHRQAIIVSVLALCAEHMMDRVLTLLSAKTSMNSRTHGEFADFHLPGNGETETIKLSSAHCHGGLLSAGFQDS